MGYRRVFSQMFDVRQRDKASDLRLGKTKKTKTDLNLKLAKPIKIVQSAGRIINLKCQIKELEITKRLEGKEIKISKKAKETQIATPLSRQYYSWQEPLETSLPEPIELSCILELIESAQQLLKQKSEGEAAQLVEETEGDEQVVPEIEGDSFYEIPIQEILPAKEFEEIEEIPLNEVIPSWEIADQPPPLYSRRDDYDIEPAIQGAHPVSGWIITLKNIKSLLGWRKSIATFLIVAFLMFSLVPLLSWSKKVLEAKSSILNSSLAGYQALLSARQSLGQADFGQAQKNFEDASRLFASADFKVQQIGGWLVFLFENLPGFSFFSSRTHLIKAGEQLSKAGQELAQILNLFGGNKISSSLSGTGQGFSAVALVNSKGYLQSAINSLISANDFLQEVEVSSLPEEVQPELVALKEKLPEIIEAGEGGLSWLDKFLAILGNQQAKKYLLIFQNNAELRATGGFIGTYGILDLDQGEMRNLFIDGIFNADGQLTERIIPPKPIQKISTAWSMHDSNWFADFPTSAKKLMWFYEKTGGPTVDGVISFTPAVFERLLQLTGPIEMPEYGISLGPENFVELIQHEVEVDYDKELNQPKKILADFAPKFIEKLSEQFAEKKLETLKIISQCLKEKHILIYFSQPELEEFILTQDWGGQILPSDKDYFSVVHSNINGFKTDRVIEEKIRYFSEIKEDGSIIDTLEITRHHQGGGLPDDWYNRVNSDYLRVYLPKGSQLLWVQGQTRQDYQPPIDYQKAGFLLDQEVLAEEQSLKIDERSGTHIFEESDKTVFANWVYVSPQETITLTYQYRLPFKLDILKQNINFSLLAQKQSGTSGSQLEIKIRWPEAWQIAWSSGPENLKRENSTINWQTDLSSDRFIGFVFNPKQ